MRSTEDVTRGNDFQGEITCKKEEEEGGHWNKEISQLNKGQIGEADFVFKKEIYSFVSLVYDSIYTYVLNVITGETNEESTSNLHAVSFG